MLAIGGVSLVMLLAFGRTVVSKQVEEANDVATSVQSSAFNLSIMIATWIGGLLSAGFPGSSGVRGVVHKSFILVTFIALLAKRTLRSS